jgi:hypothetical protein
MTILFWISCILGLLSHLSFVHIYLGLLGLSIYRLTRAVPRRVAVFDLLKLHGVPLLALATIYMTFVRNLTIGGAPEQPLWQGLSDSISRLIAVPGPIEFQVIVSTVAILLFVQLLLALARRHSDWTVFLVVAVILSPAIAITRQAMTLQYHQPLHARYFLVLLPPVMLAASVVLVELLKKRLLGPLVIVGLSAFFGASAWQTVRFIQIGRGHCSDAVKYISQRTPSAVIPVVIDHPLRTGMVLDFYSRLLPAGTRFMLLDSSRVAPAPPPVPPTWLVVHSNLTHSPPAPTLGDPWGGAYVYDREFTYYGLSGYSFYLYHRSDR